MGRYRSAIVFSFLAAFVLLRYHGVLSGFWLFDDAFLLRTAIKHNPLDFFFVPAVWRAVSVQSLTPMIMLSYRTDFFLFGLSPYWFYAHQLGILWLASAAVYLLLREYVDWRFAFLGALLFLSSAPSAVVANVLMARHYIQGLFLSLLALICFIEAVRRKSLLLSLGGSIFLLGAVAAKEIYVPVGMIILVLPEAGFRERLKCALPFLAVLVFTFWWRRVMIGDIIGGTGSHPVFSLARLVELVVRFPRGIIASVSMFSGGKTSFFSEAAGICMGLLFLPGTVSLIVRRRYSGLLFACVSVAAAYSVPLLAADLSGAAGDFFLHRLAFSIAAFLAISAALAAGTLHDHGFSGRPAAFFSYGPIIVLIVLVIITLSGSWRWLQTQKTTVLEPLRIQGEFFMSNDSSVLMVNAFPFYAPPHYFENLASFKAEEGKTSPLVTAGFFAFPGKVDAPALERVRIFSFDKASDRMVEITSEYRKERAAYLARVADMPLRVSLQVSQGTIRYALGPSTTGRYFVLVGYRSGLYPMMMYSPRRLEARGSMGIACYIRIGWECPDGRLTLSPEWYVDFSKDQKITWERK